MNFDHQEDFDIKQQNGMQQRCEHHRKDSVIPKVTDEREREKEDEVRNYRQKAHVAKPGNQHVNERQDSLKRRGSINISKAL